MVRELCRQLEKKTAENIKSRAVTPYVTSDTKVTSQNRVGLHGLPWLTRLVMVQSGYLKISTGSAKL